MMEKALIGSPQQEVSIPSCCKLLCSSSMDSKLVAGLWVYKVVKALYGLHQAPRAWHETLANYLLENDLCKAFEKLMKYKFQMSSMGEITFFLGLQVKHKQDGIFISQDKYVVEILRKFGLTDGKSASLPIDTEKPLLKDHDGEDVDVYTYRSMIASLMYLTLSKPDIMFAVCACARF
nr:hypothetical protein [Tanacetum cinerariifolium]